MADSDPTKFTNPIIGRREWADATDIVAPYVVRLQTPTGSGTGFLFPTRNAFSD